MTKGEKLQMKIQDWAQFVANERFSAAVKTNNVTQLDAFKFKCYFIPDETNLQDSMRAFYSVKTQLDLTLVN